MADKIPTVLVVDDIDTNVMILEEILKGSYNIITANNGRVALEKLHGLDALPKIILLDIFMPEMNGYQMLEEIKSDRALQRIPVIFITTSDSESDALEAGAVDFISKPFLPEIVKLRVKNQIELKNYSDNLEEMVAEKTAEVIRKTEEAKETLDNALQGLANVIEHRDLESGEHVKRTQLYVEALANYLIESNSEYAGELIKMDPEIIVKSMALHDVGKIAIPDRILQKPGRLDPVEYEEMKTHTTRGKEIIGELGDVKTSLYLKHCEDICYSHHERWDGKGYPQGLKELEIPLAARIASLADVYDALVCVRVYKEALTHDKAMRIIMEGRGSQFDPVVCDALEKVQDRFIEISRQYA
ncbi:MAG: response regulator [Treponema sp.]|jgi:putative two-component system response regulator|nr:response regulator [Treponema sp.]